MQSPGRFYSLLHENVWVMPFLKQMDVTLPFITSMDLITLRRNALGMVGSICLDKLHPFYISVYQYGVGVRCPIEFSIKKLLNCLPDEWTECVLQAKLTPFAAGEDSINKTPYWSTKESLYIDLKALNNPADLSAFCSALKEIMNLIVYKGTPC